MCALIIDLCQQVASVLASGWISRGAPYYIGRCAQKRNNWNAILHVNFFSVWQLQLVEVHILKALQKILKSFIVPWPCIAMLLPSWWTTLCRKYTVLHRVSETPQTKMKFTLDAFTEGVVCLQFEAFTNRMWLSSIRSINLRICLALEASPQDFNPSLLSCDIVWCSFRLYFQKGVSQRGSWPGLLSSTSQTPACTAHLYCSTRSIRTTYIQQFRPKSSPHNSQLTAVLYVLSIWIQ